MRGDQLVRQWELLRLLFAHQEGVKVEDLARTLNTRPRNVYRDIEVLKRAGFNVCKVTRDGSSYYFIPSDEPLFADYRATELADSVTPA